MAFLEKLHEFFVWLAEAEKLPEVESKEHSRTADRMRSILNFFALPEVLPETPAPVKLEQTPTPHPVLSIFNWIVLPEEFPEPPAPVGLEQPPTRHPVLSIFNWMALPEELPEPPAPVELDQSSQRHTVLSWLKSSEKLPMAQDFPREKGSTGSSLRWLLAREPLEIAMDTHSTNEDLEEG